MPIFNMSVEIQKSKEYNTKFIQVCYVTYKADKINFHINNITQDLTASKKVEV